ncbi:hypothetical protein NUH88_11205 [Nisaea acidiphila]|uniref:DUF3883 domain-containing protein n=1 Tax=Nisaea acidiphila TaxID=1862145 RepID=A0A9J7AJZ2_9PROT|nr:hypothetical protein [Nisaea acidiphila]UUX47987.1 hypothetical protein NUH88_11205 [Nisaea acidiphila]
MPEKLTIKVLTASDLTFFDSFYKQNKKSNQKAINLNADVFAKEHYPDFAEASHGVDVELPVRVTVFGPGESDPYKFPRSVTKKSAYKNWRLNGAAVPDPEGDDGRFDSLSPNDIAVIEFIGDARPEAVRIVLIESGDDAELHSRLQATQPAARSMWSTTRSLLDEIVTNAGVGPEHPIQALLKDEELQKTLEEGSLGTDETARRLRARKGRIISREELTSAREKAERVGSDGETLANQLLTQMQKNGEFAAFEWTSTENAAAPWDFEVTGDDPTRFDAKSTTYGFENPFHISGAEVAAAAEETPYRIIRVFDLDEDGANVRISEPMNELAKSILESSKTLPPEVRPTGFTIHPSGLAWNEPIRVDRPDEPTD